MPKQPAHKNGRKSPPDPSDHGKDGKEHNGTINNREDDSEETRQEGSVAEPPPPPRACEPIPGQPAWAPRYLAELEITGQKLDSAKLAEVNLRTVQRHRAADREFAELEAAAMEVGADLVESVITRRAIDGVVTQRTTMPDGRVIEKWDYSDTLLLRLAEKIETGSWRQKQQIEHSAPGIFATRAERKAALEKLRQETREREARSLSGTVPLSLPSETEVAGREVTERDPWAKGAE